MAKVTGKQRKEHATVRGPNGKPKYPIFNKATAKSAVKLINHAKPPLSSAQKARVRAKAAKYGVKGGNDG